MKLPNFTRSGFVNCRRFPPPAISKVCAHLNRRDVNITGGVVTRGGEECLDCGSVYVDGMWNKST